MFFLKIVEKEKKPREKQNGGIINNRGQEFHFELKHLENLTSSHESRWTCTKVMYERRFWSGEKLICKTTWNRDFDGRHQVHDCIKLLFLAAVWQSTFHYRLNQSLLSSFYTLPGVCSATDFISFHWKAVLQYVGRQNESPLPLKIEPESL